MFYSAKSCPERVFQARAHTHTQTHEFGKGIALSIIIAIIIITVDLHIKRPHQKLLPDVQKQQQKCPFNFSHICQDSPWDHQGLTQSLSGEINNYASMTACTDAVSASYYRRPPPKHTLSLLTTVKIIVSTSDPVAEWDGEGISQCINVSPYICLLCTQQNPLSLIRKHLGTLPWLEQQNCVVHGLPIQGMCNWTLQKDSM